MISEIVSVETEANPISVITDIVCCHPLKEAREIVPLTRHADEDHLIATLRDPARVPVSRIALRGGTWRTSRITQIYWQIDLCAHRPRGVQQSLVLQWYAKLPNRWTSSFVLIRGLQTQPGVFVLRNASAFVLHRCGDETQKRIGENPK